MTVNAIIENENNSITAEFLDVLRLRDMSENTITNYKSVLNRMNQHITQLKIKHHEVTQAHVYAYLETLQQYSANTRNMHLSCLYSFYNYMVELGARSNIPISKFMRSSIIRREPPYLSRTWQRVYLAFLKNHTQGDQVIGAEIMLATGMRISEVIAMDLVNDIEFRENKAYIRIRKSKGKKERICPVFNPELTPKLRELISMYFPLGSYNLNIIPSGYLYANQKFYAKHRVKVTPHILRYTFATERAEEGLSIDIIRRLLGHQFYSTTLMYIVENQQQIYNLI